MDSQHLANLSRSLTRQELFPTTLIEEKKVLVPEIVNTPKRRKKGGCGCNRRKEKLNRILPVLRLGDKVEALTEVTGIKALVERLTQSNE